MRLAEREAAPLSHLAAHNACGQTILSLGDYATARLHLEQGSPSSTRYSAPSRSSRAKRLGDGAWANPTQAVRRSAETVALAQQLAHPDSLAMAQYQAAILAHHRRDGQAVRAWAEALLTLATVPGFPLFVGHGTSLHSWLVTMQGNRLRGLAQLRQGLATIVMAGQERSRPFSTCNIDQ